MKGRFMKKVVRMVLAAAALGMVGGGATPSLAATSSGEPKSSSGWPHSVSLGRHAKFSAALSTRQQIQMFYRDGLGCRITTESARDRIHLGENYYITIVYSDAKPHEASSTDSVWLELQTDDPSALKERVTAFGGKPVAAPDPEHFVFRAPDGVVYRIVGTTEDLSRFER
jgi:hypothetical protein